MKSITLEEMQQQKYGRLTVIDNAPNKGRRKSFLCICDCGEIKEYSSNSLRRGHSRSCGCLQREETRMRCGSKNGHWNPHLTQEERKNGYRRLIEGYGEWRRSIKENADYTCDICKVRGGKLISHHLYSYREYPTLRIEISNGVYLCDKHHREFHKLFGRGKNTPEQYDMFKFTRTTNFP